MAVASPPTTTGSKPALLIKTSVLELPFSQEELRQATHDTLAANEIGSCYVRPIAFRGYGELGINPLNCPVDVVIAVWPWGAYLGEEALTDLAGTEGVRSRPWLIRLP